MLPPAPTFPAVSQKQLAILNIYIPKFILLQPLMTLCLKSLAEFGSEILKARSRNRWRSRRKKRLSFATKKAHRTLPSLQISHGCVLSGLEMGRQQNWFPDEAYFQANRKLLAKLNRHFLSGKNFCFQLPMLFFQLPF